MARRPPRATLTGTLFPYTTLCRVLAPSICRAGGLVASGQRSFAASRLFSDAAVRRRLPVREHARLKPHRDQLRPAQGFILDAPEPEPPEPVLRPDVASMYMQADRLLVRLLTAPCQRRGNQRLPRGTASLFPGHVQPPELRSAEHT